MSSAPRAFSRTLLIDSDVEQGRWLAEQLSHAGFETDLASGWRAADGLLRGRHTTCASSRRASTTRLTWRKSAGCDSGYRASGSWPSVTCRSKRRCCMQVRKASMPCWPSPTRCAISSRASRLSRFARDLSSERQAESLPGRLPSPAPSLPETVHLTAQPAADPSHRTQRLRRFQPPGTDCRESSAEQRDGSTHASRRANTGADTCNLKTLPE